MTTKDLTQNAAPLFNTVSDACRRLAIGRTVFYSLVKSKEIRVVKMGTKTLVPESELHRFAAARLEAGTR